LSWSSSSPAGRYTGSFIVTNLMKVIRNVIANYHLGPKFLWTAVCHVSGTTALCILLEMSSFRFTGCRLLCRVFGSVSFADICDVFCVIIIIIVVGALGVGRDSSLVLASQIGLLYRPWMAD
jgi:hypothetical protein